MSNPFDPAEFVRAAEWVNQMRLDNAPQEEIDRDVNTWHDLWEEAVTQ